MSETPIKGTLLANDFRSTINSGDVRESLKETSGVPGLERFWRFESVPSGAHHYLNFEGFRPNNSDQENFEFTYQVNCTGTYFTFNPPARIQSPLEPTGGIDSAEILNGFSSGTICIKVKDTGGGSSLDTVNIDRLAIKTTQ
jgi:hypothetical protein